MGKFSLMALTYAPEALGRTGVLPSRTGDQEL